ncbi:glycosyltransferase family 39 protein [Christensenella timonensis]|uniref:glycosyltransferase family 39 protein n=1 Tax=Christensenella timonensis TaxID=1816678 RepID=UPI0008297B1A|nr:glycosyltransferase family 39 protein [Christensenella timonensis]
MTIAHQKCPFSYKDLICVAFIVIISYWVTYSFALRGIDPHHDGFMLKTAADVANGLTLYKDTYTQYTSLGIYLQAFGVSLFGESVRSIHIMACIFHAFSTCLIYIITRRFSNRIIGMLTALIAISLGYYYFWNFHPWSNVFAVTFLLAACLCMIRFIEQRGTKNIFLAGVFAACSFWCKQTVGLSIFAGLVLLLLLWLCRFSSRKETLGNISWYLLGNILVFGIFMSIIIIQGAFSDWWLQAIENGAQFAVDRIGDQGSLAAAIWNNLWGVNYNPQYDWIWSLLPALSLVLFGTALTRLLIGRRQGQKRIGNKIRLCAYLCLSIFCLSSWFQYYPISCYRHAEWGAYPMFCVLAIVLWETITFLLQKMKRPQKSAWCTLLTCAVLLAICSTNIFVRFHLGYDKLTGSQGSKPITDSEASHGQSTILYNNKEFPFLNGLYLSPSEVIFYNAFNQSIAEIKNIYPDKNIVNITQLILFSSYTMENVFPKTFGVSGGYDSFETDLQEYINTESPILIADTKTLPAELGQNYILFAKIPGTSGDVFDLAGDIIILVPQN